MTDEEVEVVARALFERSIRYDAVAETRDRLWAESKQSFRYQARAAITALDAYREEKVG